MANEKKPQLPAVENSTPSEYPSHRDHILDAYFGKMGDSFMRDTQKRVHWVCSKAAQGGRILDVGCSEGIVPVLLGREGYEVIGIDADGEAIATAKDFLARQNAAVQQHVSFIHADFTRHDFAGEHFATVIIAEVLEHLINPAPFVTLAAQLLDQGGRLVVTVPFGIYDFIDHKRTCYALEPLRLVWEDFTIDEVEFFGKWIGFSCSKRPAPVCEGLTDWPWTLIQQMEEAFQKIESSLHEKIRALTAKQSDAKNKQSVANEQISQLQAQLSNLMELEQTLAARESQLKVATATLATQQEELSGLRASTDLATLLHERVGQADAELARIRAELATAETQKIADEIELVKLQEQLKYRQSLVDYQKTNLEQDIADKLSCIKELDAELVVQRNETAEIRKKFVATAQALKSSTEEITLLKAQSAQQRTVLEQTIAEKESAVQSLETTLAQLHSEVADLRAELAGASVRDQAAGELAAQLKQRIAEADEALARTKEELLAEQTQRQAEDKAQIELRGKLRERQARIEQQRNRIEQMIVEKESAVQSLETVLAQLHGEATDLRAELVEANARHQDVAEQVALLRAQIAQDEAELDHARKELDSEQAQRIAGEIELFRLQEQFRHQQALAETSLHAKEQRITTLLEAVERSRRDVEASKSQPGEEQVILAGEVADLREQLAAARAAQSELAATQQQLAQARKLAAATPETESLRQALAAAQVEEQSAQTALIKISSELEIAQALRRDEQQRLTFMTERAVRLERAASAPPAAPAEVTHSPKKGKKGKQKGTPTAVAPIVSSATPALPSPAPPFAASLQGLKVACIMDEFTYSSYYPECNLLRLTPQHWQEELEAFTPELLFIESAWKGKNDLWTTKVSNSRAELVDIVAWCRHRQVPTIFWNKEDPVHFEVFLKVAKLFDYVFTTDIDCINRYKGALGHERVYLLPFACQPQTTNPLETYERKDAFCFAGSYYAKYPERTRDLGNFVAALSDYKPIEIYDRNFGKNYDGYLFPPEYQPFIVGNLPFDQIDKAYKGYRYSINLNTIKQSQSMFARRVFDLLASNTITISNFSRGVRLLFGDLVVTTDNGHEVLRRLRTLAGDERDERKFRLAGLRKVMLEHTYQDRLAYIAAKVQGCSVPSLLPRIVVTAYAQDQQQIDALLEQFQRQLYADKRLLLVVPHQLKPKRIPVEERVQIRSISASEPLKLADCLERDEYVAGMVPDDYYGPNYLVDLALATRYSRAQVFGKISQHVWSADGLHLAAAGSQYRETSSAAARAALVQAGLIEGELLRDWVIGLPLRQIEAANVLGIDEFNYCKEGNTPEFLSTQLAAVNDLAGLETGITLKELITQAEAIAPAPAGGEEVIRDTCPVLSSAEISELFPPPSAAITYEQTGTALRVTSTLGTNKHIYTYATKLFSLEELDLQEQVKFYLDTSNEFTIQVVIIFLNAQKERLSHVIRAANVNQVVVIPPGAVWIKLGWRFYEAGTASINEFLFGHLHRRPAAFIQNTPLLVLTKRYPDYDDLYNYSFVHTRTLAYKARGVQTDVFRLQPQTTVSYKEFQNIDIISGDHATLDSLLSARHAKNILVHFLDEEMWQVLRHHLDHINIFVWIHGAEIQPWHRRDYNFETEEERETAKIHSEIRMHFWRTLLQDMPANFKLIFVSNYFAEEVMEDLGFRLPLDRYTIIHNAIDTEFFTYQEKSPEQRKKILSIRPFASRKYANDLSVQAILSLRDRPWFNELEFRMIGDGKLFDETLQPLREFSNVQIERRFLSHAEIAALHREYGVFLCPTRMDAQGVSKDEAMSSGLVPISNRVTAIPEFVDETCGLLVDAEDAVGLGQAMERLYADPELFQDLSRNAAARVRRQCDFAHTIQREIELIAGSEGAA